MRPFEDLIKPIEVDGNTFVPAARIAIEAFNYSKTIIHYKSGRWINGGYDNLLWYTFETNIMKPKSHVCSLSISRGYDIAIYHTIGGVEGRNTGIPANNQVKIFRLLEKWGFI